MADYQESIPLFDNGDSLTGYAQGAIEGARFVMISGPTADGLATIRQNDGTRPSFGISAHSADAGSAVGVHHARSIVTTVEVGATGFSAGDQVASDSVGRAVPATGSNPALTAPAITVAGHTTGGTLPANTYFYKATAFNELGETVGSAEQTLTTTGATSSVTGTIAAEIPNALGYRVYRGTVTNTENVLVATVPTGGALTWTDNGTGTSKAIPTSNTTSATLVVQGTAFEDGVPGALAFIDRETR